MELVDSILAFALIMAALASVVTLLMEAFHRALGLRVNGMKALFSQYYDEVLSKKLNIAEARKLEITDRVLINPARKIILSSSKPFFPNRVIKLITSATEVSTEEMLKRLSQTDAFKELKGKTNKEAREILESIEDQYDEYSAAISDYFKRRAKLFSLLVGIGLAFAANIDGLRIFDALMTNSQMRASFISQQESMEKSFKEGQERLEKLQSDSETKTTNKQKIEELQVNLKKVSEQLSGFRSQSLPIGWSYFPAKADKKADSQGSTIFNKLSEVLKRIISDPVNHAVWALKVLITGLLIGLGAPFWFEIARKLTQLKQAMGGKKPTVATDSKPSKPKENKTTIDKIIENN